MATISLRISSDEEKLLQTYLAAHNLNISSFIRQVVFDKIEDDLALDEKRILRARNRIDKEKCKWYSKNVQKWWYKNVQF